MYVCTRTYTTNTTKFHPQGQHDMKARSGILFMHIYTHYAYTYGSVYTYLSIYICIYVYMYMYICICT